MKKLLNLGIEEDEIKKLINLANKMEISLDDLIERIINE